MKVKIGDSVLYKGEKLVVTDIQVKTRDKYSNSKQVKLTNDDLMPFINNLHEFDTIEELNDHYVETKKTKNIHIEALKDLEQMDSLLHDFELSSSAYERLKEYITFNYYKELENES